MLSEKFIIFAVSSEIYPQIIITELAMKIYNIVFSPTGTSAKVAASVASGIEELMAAEICGCDVTRRSADLCLRPLKSDIALIAAPVYGGKMAPLAKERMKGIVADSTPCVLIAVYGNRAFENAVKDMAEFAESLGFVPVAAAAFVGEHSYSRSGTPIAEGRPDKADLADAVSFGRAIGERLKEGAMSPADVAGLLDEPLPEQSLVNFRTFVMGYMESQQANPVRLLPEIDVELCCECGKCVEVCPTEAIGSDCHSIVPEKCIKCSACVKICPVGARSLNSPFAPVLSENFSIRKSPRWIVG